MVRLHLNFRVVLMFYILSASGFAAVVAQTNETDRLALLDLKRHIYDDPFQIMMSWNDSVHFCFWKGVTCDLSNRRALILNLTSQELVGAISPSLVNLTFLTAIDLSNNRFHGGIPQEIGHVLRLQHLNLSYNPLGGSIPTNLNHCQELKVLDLTYNKLVGNIPNQLSSLREMMAFGLGANNLTGGIPTWVGNFSALERLSLAGNRLQGNIPADLGCLTSLRFLRLNENQLSGTVPSEIFNISSLHLFSLAENKLQGKLPPDVGINLPNLELFVGGGNQFTGEIPVSIGNLTFLTEIDLSNNNFHGGIPREIGHLLCLQYLNLSYNPLGGNIHSNLSHCQELTVLDLTYNKLVGNIPNQLSSLMKMLTFHLGANSLIGRIPTWVGNFSALDSLSLARNHLQGNIPADLGRLTSLKLLILFDNQLSGKISSEIFNISSIYYFTFGKNQLHGKLIHDVGTTLPNLEFFAGGINQFTGEIPISLGNASKLGLVDFTLCALTGTLPADFGKLQDLYRINFEDNDLGSKQSGDLSFLSALANCTRLEALGLGRNHFGGELPNSIANLSVKLHMHTLGDNVLEGLIPPGIENLVGLKLVGLDGNSFRGSIPDTIGKLKFLTELHINYNKLSGGIPSSIGNLTLLIELHMDNNRLEGIIPSELGSCRNLIYLNLAGNNLVGTIPVEIMGLSSLSIYLSVAQNALTGPLPLEIGKLVNLMQLDLSDNKLSGEIPTSISSCLSLEYLVLRSNLLRGRIPESMKALRGLGEIDLSQNNFSGEIPAFIGKLSSLKKLNLSFNNFVCEVSREGIFSNATALSVVGNKKLCGGIPDIHLPKCPNANRKSKFSNLKVLIPTTLSIISLVVMILVGAAFCACKSSRKKPSAEPSSSIDLKLRISYQDVFYSTNGFSENNLIGSGSYGSVYKGILRNDGFIVAVKILNLAQRGASKSFMDECNVLRSTRHRNLLKIVTVCSSIDPHGNDFKCIVSEFMSNGNLDQWLHPGNEYTDHNNKSLNIFQRLNIAIDVASAIDYLHNCCEIPIVHCDLKPNNILLDESMTTHVGDFGLAKFLFEASTNPQNNTVSDVLKGSIGYIPPEYGLDGRVSTAGDVYSYGILLLELFTGKRPTNDIFGDGSSIHEYVKMAFPGHAIEILDPLLLLEEGNHENEFGRMEKTAIIHEKNHGTIEEILVPALGIGLECSKSLPGDRLPINIALNRMQKIRDNFF